MHHLPTAAAEVLPSSLPGRPAREIARPPRLQHLADRAAFDALAVGQMSQCRRAGESLAVLWLTIDTGTEADLDAITFEALIADVAERLARCVRRTDRLLHCGGLHFGVLLPGAEEPAATTVGERLQLACSGPYQRADRLLAVRLKVELQCFSPALTASAAKQAGPASTPAS